MITLKELMEIQKLKGEYESTDIQIIQAFFELNNLEEDAIDLISQLTKSKINKIKKYTQKSLPPMPAKTRYFCIYFSVPVSCNTNMY